MITLSLYNTDTAEKWQTIFKQLHQTDYIILASNRLSTPLQRLTDCEKFQTHCYPQTAYYYKQLFSGNLGFKKIAEFQQYPTLPLFHIPVIDESADESFSVFDHPKIIIFEKKRI